MSFRPFFSRVLLSRSMAVIVLTFVVRIVIHDTRNVFAPHQRATRMVMLALVLIPIVAMVRVTFFLAEGL